MKAELAKVEWIVKTALFDEFISTDDLVAVMTRENINSFHLLNYTNDDDYWPSYSSESSEMINSKDEKYIIHFSNPPDRQENNSKRERAREAVYKRFYIGHKFNEWLV